MLCGTEWWMSGMGVMADTRGGDWYLASARSARAPAGQLDGNLALLTTIGLSLKPTPRWHTAVAKIRAA